MNDHRGQARLLARYLIDNEWKNGCFVNTSKIDVFLSRLGHYQYTYVMIACGEQISNQLNPIIIQGRLGRQQTIIKIVGRWTNQTTNPWHEE